MSGAFDSFRATFAIRRYKHDELEGEDVGTAFTNNTTEIEVMGVTRALGRLKGSLGASVLDRAFDAVGAEALSPPVDQQGFATFLYEEVTWPHVTFQFGGRVDHTSYEPNGEPQRSFTSGSGSVGLLLRPAAADDRLTIAAQRWHARRGARRSRSCSSSGRTPATSPSRLATPISNPSTHSASTSRFGGARRA